MSPPLKILTPLSFYFFWSISVIVFVCVYFGVGVLVGVGRRRFTRKDLFEVVFVASIDHVTCHVLFFIFLFFVLILSGLQSLK